MVHSAIVTDRDLAVRVVGQGLVPERTTLDEVMSTDIATLSPEDSQADGSGSCTAARFAVYRSRTVGGSWEW